MPVAPPAAATAKPAPAPMAGAIRTTLSNRIDMGEGMQAAGFAIDSRRADGWTCDRQRSFLAALAEGATVEGAAKLVGLSTSSAYAFRQRAHGGAFALGWHAALLLQRQKLADLLTSRAFDGQVDTLTRADGSEVTRHRHDNRLGLALLARLDRVAALEDRADSHGEAQAARVVSGDWQSYLDLIGADATPAQAGLFLAARAAAAAPAASGGAAADPVAALAPVLSLARADLYLRTGTGDAGAIAVADLDPARRGEWTAEQWCRAEAAGLLALAPSPPARDPQLPQHSPAGTPGAQGREPVWFDARRGEWRTAFPPPPDVDWLDEVSIAGAPGYHRELTDEERDSVVPGLSAAATRQRHAERDAWFAARRSAPDGDRTGKTAGDRHVTAAVGDAATLRTPAPASVRAASVDQPPRAATTAAPGESVEIVGPAHPAAPVAGLERPAGQPQSPGEHRAQHQQRPLARVGQQHQHQRRADADAEPQRAEQHAAPRGWVHRLERGDDRQARGTADGRADRGEADRGDHHENRGDDQRGDRQHGRTHPQPVHASPGLFMSGDAPVLPG